MRLSRFGDFNQHVTTKPPLLAHDVIPIRSAALVQRFVTWPGHAVAASGGGAPINKPDFHAQRSNRRDAEAK
jgi:hypothetical protein